MTMSCMSTNFFIVLTFFSFTFSASDLNADTSVSVKKDVDAVVTHIKSNEASVSLLQKHLNVLFSGCCFFRKYYLLKFECLKK